MSARVGVLLAVLVGCIEDDLVLCGDNLCPAGWRCVSGTCARPDQLVACVDHPELGPCTTQLGDGYCVTGVCVVSICGDGTLQQDEVCDDGNRRGGDGCRDDCLSTEICGNGLLDVGERCDCGATPDVLAAGCYAPNSDVSTAQCDLACSRHCGDGDVSGLEQCDGTNIPISCSALGFYDGAVSCTSFCALDSTTCIGTCGDGVVERKYGESCDGGPPAETCLDFGRDYGLLGCGVACQPSIGRDCGLYGWSLETNVISDVFTDGTGNARGVVGLSAAQLKWTWDLDEGVYDNVGSAWTRVLANASSFVAVGATSLARFDGQTWTEHASAVPQAALVYADDGFLYAVTSDCMASRIDPNSGASMSLGNVTAGTCGSIVADGMRVVVGTSVGIHTWNGTTWTPRSIGDASVLYASSADHIIVDTAGSLIDWNLAPTVAVSTPLYPSPGPSLLADGDGNVYSVFDDFDMRYVFVNVPVGSFLMLSGDDFVKLVRANDRSPLLVKRNSIVRLLPSIVDVNQPSPFQIGLADNERVLQYCGSTVGWMSRVDGANTRPVPSGSFCYALLGVATQAGHLLAGNGGIWRFEGGSYVPEYTTTLSVRELAGNPSAAIALVSGFGSAVAERNPNQTWTVLPAPAIGCIAYAIDGRDAASLYALYGCQTGSKIYQRVPGSPATWLQILDTTTALTTIHVALDHTVFATGGGRAYRIQGASLVDIGPGNSVRALASDDAYIETGSGFLHHTGTSNNPLRLPGNRIVLGSHHVFMIDGISIRMLLRMTYQRWGL